MPKIWALLLASFVVWAVPASVMSKYLSEDNAIDDAIGLWPERPTAYSPGLPKRAERCVGYPGFIEQFRLSCPERAREQLNDSRRPSGDLNHNQTLTQGSDEYIATLGYPPQAFQAKDEQLTEFTESKANEIGIIAAPAAPPQADLIVYHAKVWAGIKEPTTNTAIAIREGRILAVGDDKTILEHRGPTTKVIDIKGRRIVPGFHDSHVHFLSAGIFLGQIDLKLCANEEEFGKMLKEYDQKLPPGRWMLGGNWDHDRTFNGVLPTAAMIDKYVSPDRPVYLRRYDGHMSLANTVAMKKAGINANTKEINGGEVVRKAGTQEPTGILRDNAMSLMGSVIPTTDEEDIVRGIRRALEEARSVGVTSIDDIDGSGRTTRTKLWKHYKNLENRGELSVRVRLFWPITEARGLADLIAGEGRGTGLAQLGGVKGFMDGSLGSSTAKMFDPYRHDNTTTGVWVTPPSAMLQYALEADKLGLQVVVHAIGDEANAKLLDIYTEVNEKNGPRDRRFRIEHAQHLRQEDYPRFAKASVIASMQPYHVIDDAKWAEGRIGTERCSSSYAYRSLLDNGATLSFGSDWAVAPLNPLVGIDAAVNRRSLDGKYPAGWFPAQKIKVEEALHGYTAGAAYAMFAEKQQGVLKPGMNADIVVLDRDILDKNEQDNIAKTTVVMTIVHGKIVYQR